jgi:DNA uptake protein ComE-like DNA-binding protein
MHLAKLGLAATLGALLALPVFAQSTGTTPATKAPATTSMPAAGTPAGTAARTTQNGTASSAAQGKLVDLNTASVADLDTLPGIGKTRAEAIIKNRPYKGKDELVTRHVLPQNIYNGIKDKVVARHG